MKIILGLVVLIPLWGFSYLLVRKFLQSTPENEDTKNTSSFNLDKAPMVFAEYADWIAYSLDAMFKQADQTKIKRMLIGLILLGVALGFLVPAALPGLNQYTLNSAVEYNRKGQYAQAMKLLKDFAGEPSPLVHNEIGVAHLGMRNYDKAAESFRNSIKYLVQYAKPHANLAVTYFYLDKHQRAKFQWQRAKEMEKFPVTKAEVYNLDHGFNYFLGFLCAAVFMFLLYRIPRLVIKIMRARRMKSYDDQIADGLLMAANGLRAGFSLLQALEVVAEESPSPLNQEFRLVLKEHQLGADLDVALEHLAQRMPTPDTRIFVNSLSILRETGGKLTEVFDTLAETIQERKRVQQKIKTMTAEGTTQAYILSILPIVLGFVMYKLNPEDMSLFFTTSVGWMLVLLIILMETIGFVWMMKLVKVRI